jgi:hypothetical protein
MIKLENNTHSTIETETVYIVVLRKQSCPRTSRDTPVFLLLRSTGQCPLCKPCYFQPLLFITTIFRVYQKSLLHLAITT